MALHPCDDEDFVPLFAAAQAKKPLTGKDDPQGQRKPSRDEARDCGQAPDGSRLYWFEEAPRELQYNRFIRSGYRAGLSPSQCMASWFYCHNESGNIWAHMLPALVILGLLTSRTVKPWPLERLAFYGNVLPILLCFCGSVMYHTLMANHSHYRTWLLLDVCGVFALLVCGTHTLLFWGLFCHPILRTAFIAGYYIGAIGAVFMGLRAKSHFHRALPMLFLLLIRTGALVARLAMVSGSPDASMHYIWMECLAITGAIINIMRIPERWVCPMATRGAAFTAGIFDFWLNSHQIMHILVAFALMHYHLGATHDYHHFVALNGVCS